MQGILLALALLALPGGAAAGIYKWTDAQGRVHYGDKPAGGHQDAAEPVQPRDYRPGTNQQVLDVYQRTDRIYDARDRQKAEQAERERQKAEERERAEQDQKDRCFAARERERRIAGPVQFVDDYGRPVQVSEAERRQKLAELRQWIATHCPR